MQQTILSRFGAGWRRCEPWRATNLSTCFQTHHAVGWCRRGWDWTPRRSLANTNSNNYICIRPAHVIRLNGSNTQLETYGGGDKTNNTEVRFG